MGPPRSTCPSAEPAVVDKRTRELLRVSLLGHPKQVRCCPPPRSAQRGGGQERTIVACRLDPVRSAPVKAARRDVADVPEQLGFYERMLPQRERPLDALGGILNGLGAGSRHPRADLVAAPPRHRRGRAGGAQPGVRARARDPEPLRLGLRHRRPRLADRHDARRPGPQAAQPLMAVAEQVSAWDVFEQFERDVCQLGRVGGLLDWDEQVNMPPRGASARGEAKATLAGVLHERICDERFGEAIAELGDDGELGDFERARVREARRERDRAVRVPAALVRELAIAESAGFEAWQVARSEADFSLFRNPLERLVSLRREEADAVGYEGGERYDALLDQYEPDMRVARLEPLLHGLRDELVPFVQEIAARPRPDNAFVHRTYPTQIQRAVGARLATAIGFDFEAGRLDEAAHPFASGFAPGDVRLTTREQRGRPLLRPLRRAARGRARPLRAGPHGRHRGHVLRPRHLARPARVAVALLGEHGRPLAGVLGAAHRRRSGRRSPSS